MSSKNHNIGINNLSVHTIPKSLNVSCGKWRGKGGYALEQSRRWTTCGALQIHGGGTSTDGKKCNSRQRDSKREKKKSRPLVVKAPSHPLPSAISLFRSFFFFLSFSLSPSRWFIQHSCRCTRLLCEGGSKTTRVALNSIMAAVHFFLLSHTFPRIVRRGKKEREECGEGLRLSSSLYFFRSSCWPTSARVRLSSSAEGLGFLTLLTSLTLNPFSIALIDNFSQKLMNNFLVDETGCPVSINKAI